MKDVMIDIETWGTRPTSAIIQIGACYFDRETGEIGKEFLRNIDYVVSTEPFTTDEATMQWWSEQSQEAKDSLNIDPMPIKNVLEELSEFLKKADYLWSHATFDIPIICNAYSVFEMKIPVHYRGMRDIRTLMDLANHMSEKVREGIHHNGLDDAKFQVGYVVEALNKLSTPTA